jgi:hypothetical protein
MLVVVAAVAVVVVIAGNVAAGSSFLGPQRTNLEWVAS